MSANRSYVWSRRRPINYPKTIEISGGVAAALLAGFSLTTVAQLVVGKDHPWLEQPTIVAFTMSAVLFVYALQFTSVTLGYNATPQERLDYNPEAAVDQDALKLVRRRQWEEAGLRDRYQSRSRHCYNLGMVAFLAGFGFLIVPQKWDPWPWGKFFGVLIVGFAVIVEILWSYTDRLKWLLPEGLDESQLMSSPTFPPDDLDDEGMGYLFPHRDR
jgi:hypothetical protein